ncbi:hypothetical protein GT23_1309 [Parageobacillus thermoglucosidasius]|nr:hypothetical protein GT23_1309 [Parageobacillus thermoglucosidasius]
MVYKGGNNHKFSPIKVNFFVDNVEKSVNNLDYGKKVGDNFVSM